MPTPNTPEDTQERRNQVRNQYLNLYLLASYLQDIRLVNKVMLLSVSACRDDKRLRPPSCDFVTRVYKQTPNGSLLRALLVESFACRLAADYAQDFFDETPK
jgi:hypothetical protein